MEVIIIKIAIGSDHVGLELKSQIIFYIQELGHYPIDFGTYDTKRTDYPIYAEKVAKSIFDKECELGVLICGTGIGISISANKIKGIRAAACSEPYSARLARQHNDANIVAFGSRVVGIELAKMIVYEFLNAEFEGGRHQSRIDLISKLEEKGSCL